MEDLGDWILIEETIIVEREVAGVVRLVRVPELGIHDLVRYHAETYVEREDIEVQGHERIPPAA